jgi:hypothetical protein
MIVEDELNTELETHHRALHDRDQLPLIARQRVNVGSHDRQGAT